MKRLADWLQHQQPDNQIRSDLDRPFIPKQFSAQFADQFTTLPAHLTQKADTLSVEEYMARLRFNIDQGSNQLDSDEGLDNYDNLADSNGTLVSSVSSISSPKSTAAVEILDCGLKLILTDTAGEWFNLPLGMLRGCGGAAENISQCIYQLTGCHVQLLSSASVVSKSREVSKIAIIGPTLNQLLRAQELLLDFVQMYRRKFRQIMC